MDAPIDPWKSSDVDIPSSNKRMDSSFVSTQSSSMFKDSPFSSAIPQPPDNKRLNTDLLSNAINNSNRSSSMDSMDNSDEYYQNMLRQLWHCASTEDSHALNRVLVEFKDHYLQVDLLNASKAHNNNNSTHSWKKFLDSKDSDGLSALHHAACFGIREACWILLSHGASIDIQDKHGWTPLVWATNNAHEDVVKLLIEQGASVSQNLSMSTSMSVGDFIQHSTPDIDPDSHLGAVLGLRKSNNNSTGDMFYKAAFDFGDLDRELNSTLGNGLGSGMDSPIYEESGILSSDESEMSTVFNWNECMPDQMYVFDIRQVEKMSEVLVSKLTIPHISKSSVTAKLASANTLFLAARFAHYFGSPDLMDVLFEAALTKLQENLSKKSKDMSFLAYWLSNSSQLVYFLKRDPGLLMTSTEWQVRWSEVVEEIYFMIIDDVKRRLDRVWKYSIMTYENIPGTESIKWDDKRRTMQRPRTPNKQGDGKSSNGWLGFFRFKKSSDNIKSQDFSSSAQPNQSKDFVIESTKSSAADSTPSSAVSNTSSSFGFPLFASTSKSRPPHLMSPRSITTLFSSTLFVLQSYQTHPSFQKQILRQILYYLNASIINQFFNADPSEHLCSRWKAMQIRMNLSFLEDWLRRYSSHQSKSNHGEKKKTDRPVLEDLIYPLDLDEKDVDFIHYLAPSITACQILQVATSSFAEVDASSNNNPMDSFLVTLKSLSGHVDSKNHPVDIPALLQNGGMDVNARQIFRLLSNYSYVQEEPFIANEVLGFLEAICIQNDAPKQQPQPEKEGKPADIAGDLIDLNDQPMESDNKQPSSKMEIDVNTKYLLPFKLTYVFPDDPKGSSNQTAAESSDIWEDPIEQKEKQKRSENLRRKQNSEETWWERRLKIEVPEWIMKQLQ